MDEDKLEPWKIPVKNSRLLANPEIDARCLPRLTVVLEDLDSRQKWKCSFSQVVAIRDTRHFRMKRLANTFVVRNSQWIAVLLRDPMLIPGKLDGTQH